MIRRRYTRELLQLAADRWTAKLIAKGFNLPDIPITVYTSAVQFEAELGDDPAEGQSCLGQAGWSVNDFPIVYVKLPRSRYGDSHEPLVILIHELLHHVTPKLDHNTIFELAEKFRAEDSDSILPPVHGIEVDVEDKPEIEGSEAERRECEVLALEGLDELWLNANGFPSARPRRSRLTGRFIKRDPRWGDAW